MPLLCVGTKNCLPAVVVPAAACCCRPSQASSCQPSLPAMQPHRSWEVRPTHTDTCSAPTTQSACWCFLLWWRHDRADQAAPESCCITLTGVIQSGPPHQPSRRGLFCHRLCVTLTPLDDDTRCSCLCWPSSSPSSACRPTHTGSLADMYGGKPVLTAGVALWSLFTVVTPQAAAAGTVPLMAARVLLGVGEGVAFPAIHSMIGGCAQCVAFIALSCLSTHT